ATGIGGSGWDLDGETGLYCLNTALCSFAGLSNSRGPINDQTQLMIDTRSLHSWLASSRHKHRILVMHHPVEWLTECAQLELSRVMHCLFSLVFSGHVHRASSTFATQERAGFVHCVAPPLFTNKHDSLGYSFVTLDTETGHVAVVYRQWSESSRRFV